MTRRAARQADLRQKRICAKCLQTKHQGLTAEESAAKCKACRQERLDKAVDAYLGRLFGLW